MSNVPDEPQNDFRPKFLDPKEAKRAEYVGELSPEETRALIEEVEPAIIEDNSPKNPNKPLTARAKEACRLIALGWTPADIGAKLKYATEYVTNARNTPRWKAEIARNQDKMFEQDVMTRLKDLGPDSVNVIEELMRDPSVSALKKADKAQWVIEKLTGKAKQEHSVESNTLAAFTEIARQMLQSGEKLDDIDVTPQTREVSPGSFAAVKIPQVSTESKFTKWVDEEI